MTLSWGAGSECYDTNTIPYDPITQARDQCAPLPMMLTPCPYDPITQVRDQCAPLPMMLTPCPYDPITQVRDQCAPLPRVRNRCGGAAAGTQASTRARSTSTRTAHLQTV